MRIGFNPNKNKTIDIAEYTHQVIIPVYIPNEEGYFKDSFQILKYCLESLFKTSHSKTFYTIVNNGSSKIVVDYLNELYINNKIYEIIHTTNIGKFNAILKGLTGQSFQLITVTDADVLFLNDWQKETYNIFKNFPNTGVVSTTPNPKLVKYFTSNIIFNNLFSTRIKLSKVKNPNAMKQFAYSIGNENLFKEYHLNKYLTISNGKEKAVIGAGHFVATYKLGAFKNMRKDITVNYKMGSVIRKFLDKPINDLGYWRLSTEDNYTYHMGNTVESWMTEVSNKLIQETNTFELLNIKKEKNIFLEPYL